MRKVLVVIVVLLIVVLLESCKSNKNLLITDPLKTQKHTNNPEYPTDFDELRTILISDLFGAVSGEFSGDIAQERIQVMLIDGYLLYQGDIIVGEVNSLDSSSLKTQSLVLTDPYWRWENGIVPYEITSSVNPVTRTYIESAINHWNTKTNVQLVQRTNQSDFVAFESPSSAMCNSYVGRIRGRQVINLHETCGFGAAVHEIGHAVGIFHEHSRPDRDNFVSINYPNIAPDFAFAFDKESTTYSNTIGAYDFDSIMHYEQFAFANNVLIPTITPIDSLIDPNRLGQRSGLSPTDIAAINQIYPVSSTPSSFDEWLVPLLSEYLLDELTTPHASSSPNLSILDNTITGVTDTIYIPYSSFSGSSISSMTVDLNITHTWVGDLEVRLQHSDTSTEIVLMNQPLGSVGTCSGDNLNITITDSATNSLHYGCMDTVPAYINNGSYYPYNQLAAFNGDTFNGYWVLTVIDSASSDTGTLNSWSLTFQ